MNPRLCPQYRQRENLTFPVSLVWKWQSGDPLSGVCDLEPTHVTITPGCSDDGENWASRLPAGNSVTKREESRRAWQVHEKLPPDTANQPRKQSAQRSAGSPGGQERKEKKGTWIPGDHRTFPMSPRSVRGQSRETWKRGAGSSACGSSWRQHLRTTRDCQGRWAVRSAWPCGGYCGVTLTVRQAPSPGAGDGNAVCSQLRPSQELSRLCLLGRWGHSQCLVDVGTPRPGPLASVWDNSAGQSKPQASLMGWSLHLQA